MKLATLRNGTRDGQLIIVSRDLSRAITAPPSVPTLQAALDNWSKVLSELLQRAEQLEDGAPASFAFNPREVLAPLPRAYHWVDGSAYVNHVELVRKARGADLPASYWSDPLVYQGGSDDFLGSYQDAPFTDPELGIDFEAEVAVILDDVPIGTRAAEAARHIKLVLLVNDWSLRNLIPSELAKQFGFYQSKPATAFSPVAVTPDELGSAWDGGKVCLPLITHINGQLFGRPHAGVDMTFEFPALIEHITKTRNARAGTILGAGTVSNYDRKHGSACIAERRVLEQIEHGKAITPFLQFGDHVRIEMLDNTGKSVFGAIDQRVVRALNP